MKNILAGLLIVVPLCAGCQSDEPWTFAITRGVWSGLEEAEFEASPGDEGMAHIAACLILCPVAIDIALLPITLTRDLVIEDY